MLIKRYRKRRPWIPPPGLTSKVSNPKFRERTRAPRYWRYGRNYGELTSKPSKPGADIWSLAHPRRSIVLRLSSQPTAQPAPNRAVSAESQTDRNDMRLSEILARHSTSRLQLQTSRSIMESQAIRIAQLEAQNRILLTEVEDRQYNEELANVSHPAGPRPYHDCQKTNDHHADIDRHQDFVPNLKKQTMAELPIEANKEQKTAEKIATNGHEQVSVPEPNKIANKSFNDQGSSQIAGLRDQLKYSQKLVEQLRRKLRKYVSIVASSGESSEHEPPGVQNAEIAHLKRENERLRREIERHHVNRLGQENSGHLDALKKENEKLKATLKLIFDRYDTTFGTLG